MGNPINKLREDRAMRNAARALVKSDVSFIKDGIEKRSIPSRISARLGGGARDIADEATLVAQENRASVTTGLAIGAVGLVAWLFREKIIGAVDVWLSRDDESGENGEPDGTTTRSENI